MINNLSCPTENRRLRDKLTDAVPVQIAFVSRGKLARLGYCLAISIFNSLVGCALVDETPINPTASAVTPAQTEQPTVIPIRPVTVALPSIAPFHDAVTAAADALFSQVILNGNSIGAPPQQSWVIDPLIDGVSGVQSNATRAIEARTVKIVRSKYPQFNLRSFSAANLQDSPLLFLGTFTPVNNQGEPTGRRKAFRICLVLADLKTGKISAKVTTRTYMDRLDHTPTPYFRDSPAWMKEAATDGYIAACQGDTVGGST